MLAQPQLPFSKFVTEPWHTTGLTLSASVVSESSWVWPVASDYLLIGQRFRPAYQSGAKAYIWGAIHVSQTCGRVIALLRLEILQHVHRGCISANQLCGNGFTPIQIEHSGTNADNNKMAIQDLYKATNPKMWQIPVSLSRGKQNPVLSSSRSRFEVQMLSFPFPLPFA